MYKRPNPQETDEDLLRLQEEFIRNKQENKIKLAATVVNSQRRETTNEEISTNNTTTNTYSIEDQLANTFEAIPDNKSIGKILQKCPTSSFVVPNLKFTTNSKGFPKAKRRDADLKTSSGGGSIFSQQIKRLKTNTESTPTTTTKVNQSAKIPSQSCILTGNNKTEIHQENVEKLQSMSEQEILEERQQLLETMDPALIAYLKSKRKKVEQINRNPTIKEQDEVATSLDFNEINTLKDVLNQQNKWLNFDVVETNKLAWMKDVDVPKIDKTKACEARFDFDGWLLPFSEPNISEKSRILYHHGEEPGRPGYTLQELFQLSRSEVTQQKIIALNTIANILALSSTGVYEDVINLPIEQVFFVIRFCLDDNTPSVLNASIKAMRNLIFNKVDETCLDCLLNFGCGFIQPVLAIDNVDEDDSTVNDQQLVETNLIKCLARTEILTRIRYIITTIKPTIETITYCLDILIRLVRDSNFIFMKVYKCEGLLECIVKNFLPKTVNVRSEFDYQVPMIQAMKFVRILSCRSKTIAEEFIARHKIMDSIISYLSNEKYSSNANGLRLQTECLNFWAVLVHYNLSLNYFRIFRPILMDLLSYHYKNTNLNLQTTYIRQSHVAALLNLFRLVARNNFNSIHFFIDLLIQCFEKWTKQFMILENFECGKLQMISSSFACICEFYKNFEQPRRQFVDGIVRNLLNSQGFATVTQTIKNGSMFLNNYETIKSNANLKTVESVAWYASEHVIPIIQKNSCLPFLSVFSNFINLTEDYNVKLQFLQHENINNYINSLVKLENYYLINNWFSKIENNFLMNVLKISIVVKQDLDTFLFYDLAVKSLSVFHSEQKSDIKYILINIIFNSKYYPTEALMNSLRIEEGKSEALEVSLNNLPEILEVYTQVLGLKQNIPNFSTNLTQDISLGNVIPIDWIYTPIIAQYSNQQKNTNNKIDEIQQTFIIKNCLRWILIYETYFPTLIALINPTDRFCRIACTFLGSDSLFLNVEIHKLLELCLKNITSVIDELNFDKEIQGLNSFQDFYTQLLEQYQGVSYGDVLFGNFILIPLIQKHNVQWRKMLWSEYMGVVEIFNVTKDECVCPIDLFLSPIEEDVSLLKCYRRALSCNLIRKHSVLYEIAKFHVEQYILRIRNK